MSKKTKYFNLLAGFLLAVFLFSTLYYVRELVGDFRNGKFSDWLNIGGFAFCLSGIFSAVCMWRSRENSERRSWLFRKFVFWRWALYGIVGLIIITCLFGEKDPRSLAKVIGLAGVAAVTFIISGQKVFSAVASFRKTLVFKIIDIGLFNIVLFLLLAEAGLRVLSVLSGSPLLTAPNLKAAKRIQDYKLPAGKKHLGFSANSLGFYDREFSTGKQADTFRVLGLTDSFGVETAPYKNNFLTLLETEIPKALSSESGSKITGKTFEVMNLGVDSISPEGYLYLLREFYKPYNCDMALVCIFVGNDIDGLPEKTPSVPWLRKNFWYVYFVGKRIGSLIAESENKAEINAEEASPSGGEGHESEKPTFSRPAFLRIESERLQTCLPRGKNKKLDRKYQRMKKILSDMKAVTDGKMLVIVIPDEYQVNDSLLAEVLDKFSLKRSDYELERPQNAIKGFCAEEEIPVLDLLPVLKAGEGDQPTYHLQDTHWNAFGHSVAAKKIAEKIIELNNK